MRILELTDACSWSGGIEQLVLLTKGLVEKGHEIFIGCNSKSRLFKYAEGDKDIVPIVFDMHKEIDIKTIREIIKFVRKNKIDIIHAHHSKAHTLGFIASLWLPETVFIYTRRVIFKIRKNPFSYYKYRSKRVDGIVAVSEAVKKILCYSGVSPQKITVIYSGVDINKFHPAIDGNKIRQEFNIKSDDVLIGKIANYSDYKGHDVFLKAAQSVIKKCSYAKFIIVGEGTQNGTLEQITNELGISGNVVFTGYRRDIPEIISAFDVSVNVSNFEGLAGVIRESSAVGKPVIATSIGGNPEIVRDGETGYLVPCGDSLYLAECILKLIKNKEKLKEFGNKGRKFIEENFTTQIMIEKYIKLYERLYKEREYNKD
ncbi:MAG: glycosyltransferase family 4 protein [Candidatus Firestonebacteria bacterium]|nr:glycosyltransferase family 4 protein [Candidatus Firestonebacteria bacterium]